MSLGVCWESEMTRQVIPGCGPMRVWVSIVNLWVCDGSKLILLLRGPLRPRRSKKGLMSTCWCSLRVSDSHRLSYALWLSAARHLRTQLGPQITKSQNLTSDTVINDMLSSIFTKFANFPHSSRNLNRKISPRVLSPQVAIVNSSTILSEA